MVIVIESKNSLDNSYYSFPAYKSQNQSAHMLGSRAKQCWLWNWRVMGGITQGFQETLLREGGKEGVREGRRE
jgi:hypothetical protein